jgi:Na+/proline symporter
VALWSTALTLLFCSLGGYAFAMFDFRYKNALFAMVLGTMLLPGFMNMIPTFMIMDMLGWIAALFTMALGSIPQQDVFQRDNSAKNESVAVWGNTLGGLSYFFFAAVPLFLAYTANIIDPAMVTRLMEQDSQLIQPTLVLNHMPFFLQVVFFGALLSVIMSTASGTLLAPSVTFSENILKSFAPRMTDQQFLWATRLTVVVFTVIVTYYAIATEASIHTMVENAYRITLAGAFVPLTAGLFWKRASNLGGGLSIIMGLSTWILLEITGFEGPGEPQLIGLFASLIGMVLGSIISPNRPRDPHHHHAKASPT